MKSFAVWTIVLLLAGLGLLALLERTRSEVDEETRPGVLLVASPPDVERVAFRNYERGGGEVVVVRRGDSWWMESPFEAPAEEERIERLLRILTAFPRLVPFESEDADEELGLGRALRARITVSGGFGETRFEIGIRLAALGDELVVRRTGHGEPGGGARTHRFPATLWNAIDDTPFNFRRKRLGRCAGPELRHVRMERAGGEPIVLTRDADGPFAVERPYRATLDGVDSQRLAGALADLRIDQVLYGAFRTDDGGLELDYDPVRLGLEPPSFVLTFGDGGERTTTLHLGLPESALSEAGELPNVVPRWYARLPGETDVFVVREDPLADLLGDGTSLRPRRIGRAFGAPVVRAVWRGGPHGAQGPGLSLRAGRDLVVAREGAVLRTLEPVAFRVDGERFAGWLDGFAELEARAFRLRRTLPQPFEPAASLELEAADGERIAFQAADADPRGDHLVAFGDPDLLAVVDAGTLALLWPDPARLLERRLLPCDAVDVVRVRWIAAGAEEPAFDVLAEQPLVFVAPDGQGLLPRDQERVLRWIGLSASHRLLDVDPPEDPVWTLHVETRGGAIRAIRFFERGDALWAAVDDDPLAVLAPTAVAFPR